MPKTITASEYSIRTIIGMLPPEDRRGTKDPRVMMKRAMDRQRRFIDRGIAYEKLKTADDAKIEAYAAKLKKSARCQICAYD